MSIVIESGVIMKKEYTKLDIIKADIAAVLMQYENKGYRLEGNFFGNNEFYIFVVNSLDEFSIRIRKPFGRYIIYGNLQSAEIELEIIGDKTKFKPLMDMLGIGLNELQQKGDVSRFVLSENCDTDMISMLIGCITLKVINRDLNNLLEDIAKEMEY